MAAHLLLFVFGGNFSKTHQKPPESTTVGDFKAIYVKVCWGAEGGRGVKVNQKRILFKPWHFLFPFHSQSLIKLSPVPAQPSLPARGPGGQRVPSSPRRSPRARAAKPSVSPSSGSARGPCTPRLLPAGSLACGTWRAHPGGLPSLGHPPSERQRSRELKVNPAGLGLLSRSHLPQPAAPPGAQLGRRLHGDIRSTAGALSGAPACCGGLGWAAAGSCVPGPRHRPPPPSFPPSLPAAFHPGRARRECEPPPARSITFQR